MIMKSTLGLLIKKSIFVLTVVFVVAGVAACTRGKPATDTTYKLTHSAADAEFILSWDSIVSECPDIEAYDKQEGFLYRGETIQISSTKTSSMDIDSPMALSSRLFVFVQKAPAGENFRGFGIYIMYCETAEYLDDYIELMKMSGITFKEDGDYVTAVLESGRPTQSVQLHVVGNQFYILFMATASSDETLFFSKDKLMELISTVKSNISLLEITPLPSEIPERELVEDTHDWYEFMTFRSDELPLPVRVPEEDWYNDLIFSERPLVQAFNFVMDKDWRFIMTATGEIDTKFEVYATVSESGEQEHSYSSDQVFHLYSETVTFTREQPLEEGYGPPVNIEIKVFFDSPLAWVITIEK